MRLKETIMGVLGLVVFSVWVYFFFGLIIQVISIPIWLVYVILRRRQHV